MISLIRRMKIRHLSALVLSLFALVCFCLSGFCSLRDLIFSLVVLTLTLALARCRLRLRLLMRQMAAFNQALLSVSDELKTLSGAAGKIAAGDLSQQIAIQADPILSLRVDDTEQRFGAFNETVESLNQLGRSFQAMNSDLRALLGRLSSGSDHLTAASTRISSLSRQSHQFAETTAATSEEVTATIQEMATSIRQVAANASYQTTAAAETSSAITGIAISAQHITENIGQLYQLTLAAGASVQQGHQTLAVTGQGLQRLSSVMDQTSRSIIALQSRAENICRLVETIEEIADQTNLLALNAAIEAARAGQHGLGFSVVADEVRKLAELSARSTREIGELLGAIRNESRQAAERMSESDNLVRLLIEDHSLRSAMEHIGASVERTIGLARSIETATTDQSVGAMQIAQSAHELSRLTQEISAATHEQSVGALQIVNTMKQLGATVWQSAEMAENLQHSAEQLDQCSSRIQAELGRFSLTDPEVQRETSAPPSPTDFQVVSA